MHQTEDAKPDESTHARKGSRSGPENSADDARSVQAMPRLLLLAAILLLCLRLAAFVVQSQSQPAKPPAQAGGAEL